MKNLLGFVESIQPDKGDAYIGVRARFLRIQLDRFVGFFDSFVERPTSV